MQSARGGIRGGGVRADLSITCACHLCALCKHFASTCASTCALTMPVKVVLMSISSRPLGRDFGISRRFLW